MRSIRRPVWLLPLLLCIVWAAEDGAEEQLIGWKGETYSGSQQSDHASTAGTVPWIETISWQPRAFIFHGFLSHAECDHLKGVANQRLERSMVVGDDGKDAVDPVRTSFSASINVHETEVIRDIEHRIANWTHLPIVYGEPMEVLRYTNNQKYESHWDWFGKESMDSELGDRVATVLMYLSDVLPDGGGETALPLARAIDSQLQSTAGMSECATGSGISIRPRKGDALLFWNSLPDAKLNDRLALHASCPTLKGEKWTATKWIHTKPYLQQSVIDDAERELLHKRQLREAEMQSA